MDRESTKSTLKKHLMTDSPKVIALKGLWGSGKTHLWKEVVDDIDEKYKEKGRKIYTSSCFGVTGIDDLKKKLVVGAYEKAIGVAGDAASGVLSIIAGATAMLGGDKTVDGIRTLGGVAAKLSEALIMDKILKNSLIIIDDLERSKNTIDIVSLMGLADEMRLKGSTVLLILNEDEYGDMWWMHKEKVVDHEITVETSVHEACGLALDIKMPHREIALDTLELMDTTNIRTVKRVSETINEVLSELDVNAEMEHNNYAVETLVRAICVCCVVQYRGSKSLLNDIKKWNDNQNDKKPEKPERVALISDDHLTELTKRVKLETENPMAILCQKSKLTNHKNLLDIVASKIRSGHSFSKQFLAFFDEQRKYAKKSKAYEDIRFYIKKSADDPSFTNEDLRKLALTMVDHCKYSSPRDMNYILIDLTERNFHELADQLIESWAAWWKEHPQEYNLHYSEDEFHPKIVSVMKDAQENNSEKPTLLDAVLRASSGGQSEVDAEAINSASAEYYETVIRSLGENFIPFIGFFMKEGAQSSTSIEAHESRYYLGVNAFRAAADSIQEQPKTDRYSELLSSRFRKVYRLELAKKEDNSLPT